MSFDYPLGFLREIDGVKKDEILKVFIDLVFDDVVKIEEIHNEKLRNNFVALLNEADKAATAMEGKLASIQGGANREKRRKMKKTAKDRAKEAGLVVLEPNVPKAGKLIIE